MTEEHPEQRARRQIDTMLAAAGWAVQDRAAMNLAAGGVAVRELPTSAGPADYMLFLGNHLVGVVEAKRAGVTLSTVEAQTRDYAAKAPRPLQVPVRPLPFLYESHRRRHPRRRDPLGRPPRPASSPPSSASGWSASATASSSTSRCGWRTSTRPRSPSAAGWGGRRSCSERGSSRGSWRS